MKDSDNLKTCYVGKVLHLYEDLTNSKALAKKALVHWYYRPGQEGLEDVKEEDVKLLNKDHEIVLDASAEEELDINAIFDVAKLCDSLEECKKTRVPKARFFCHLKLHHSTSKKSKHALIPLDQNPNNLKITLKRIDENENFQHLKSPHGKWSVRLDDAALNSIENTPKGAKRANEENDKTPRKRILPSTPTSKYTCEKGEGKVSALKRQESMTICENLTPSTPTSKGIVRRKSILKTPTTSKPNTPRRSIQFSKVVDQRTFEKNPAHSLTSMEEDEECTSLAMARRRLHVSAVPKTLPCREKEFVEIYSFLEGNLLDETGGCIYISGVPGTGKTATTTAVIRALQAEVQSRKLPNFDFVGINGMKITEPRKAYVEIHKQLTGETIAWEQAYNRLDSRFSNPAPRRKTTILLVDELDILCNKRQDVVYNLLNWPNLNSARLVVVTIANTMDLPERVFMGKVSSRLGLTRLTFQPYSFKQLQEIVASRLGQMELFNSDAIQLVARKVAALSGDARRALDICRRASEIAELEASTHKTPPSVSMANVQQALTEMISCPKVQAIKSCSKMEKFFLQAVCVEVERTGVEEVVFRGVYNQFKAISTLNGVRVPTVDSGLNISNRLSASRLLISEHSRKDIYQKILLNISPDDFYFATQLRQQD